jgi:LPS-assembly protein
MMRGLLALLVLVLGLGPGLHAQEAADPAPAILIADSVFISNNNTLVAEGNVEALQGDIRLRASKITYDQSTGQMQIIGPITIQQGENQTILADTATLDDSLQDGLVTGARLVLNQQLQLAAVSIAQSGGRYSQLYKASVTSCRICGDGQPPLWQIRAKQVIHDRAERQLYFDEAQFRILDVPVLYVPRLRLPDPTLTRATGFLIPTVKSTTQLSTGVKVPYFIRIGDDKDLTLTPYLSSRTRTLQFRYRQALRNGDLYAEGALSNDDLETGGTRGYLFADGAFDLRNDFKLAFEIEATSDKAYLLDYDFSDTDRLTSFIELSRTRRDRFFAVNLTHFNSLRDDESNSTQASLVGDVFYDYRFFPAAIGGEVRVENNLHSHYRSSDLATDGPDADLEVDGRDVTRLSSDVAWLNGWNFANGLRADARLGVSVDLFHIRQDSTYKSYQTEVLPQSALALRYPMTRAMPGGAVQFLEPLAQIAWIGSSSNSVPNDESTRVDFDEGNLLALSRFPAQDRRENGLVGAYGLNWARFDENGWDANLSVGQVIRETADSDFTPTSGLTGTRSDFLVAGQLKAKNGFRLSARTLFDDSLNFSKAEIRSLLRAKRVDFIGSYVWLAKDFEEDRDRDVSELALAGSVPISRHWTASANWRYDVVDSGPTRAGAVLTYRNECVEVDLSVQRRFTSSGSVEPSTSFGFTVALRGFNVTTGTENYTRSCGKQAK